MRFARAFALVAVFSAALAADGTSARGDIPSGSVGLVAGAKSGASGSYAALGIGASYGLTAAWQPMAEEQRIGWGLRWSTLFGYFPSSSSAPVSGVLRLVEMDLIARLRIAPTFTPGRYLTVGVGASIFRANEPIYQENERSFLGPVATIGYEHYAWGAVLLGVDVRYGLIEAGPTSIGLLVSFGTAL